MNQDKYVVATSMPIDSWDGYIHISEFSDYIENFMRENPRCNCTFYYLWNRVLDKIHWSFAICDKIDKNLRSPDIYIKFDYHSSENPTEAFQINISILFKADNNGIVYLIVDQQFEVNDYIKSFYHEHGGEWEIINMEKKNDN